MEGIVKWSSVGKGYEFIESQGKDYFVYRWDIEVNSELEKGDRVSFKVEKFPKDFKAVNVKKISERKKRRKEKSKKKE